MNATSDSMLELQAEKSVINPYGFVAEDWHNFVFAAWTNAIIPALVYLPF